MILCACPKERGKLAMMIGRERERADLEELIASDKLEFVRDEMHVRAI